MHSKIGISDTDEQRHILRDRYKPEVRHMLGMYQISNGDASERCLPLLGSVHRKIPVLVNILAHPPLCILASETDRLLSRKEHGI